jgi:hypothetical protein
MIDGAVRVHAGGSTIWRDVSIRYLKLVPMSAREVAHHQSVRAAAAEGRDFAGYLEPTDVPAYGPPFISLRQHIHNEIGLHVLRGSTDVYVLRIGCRAWYRSNVVEWDETGENYTEWMHQGDPAQVAVEEARAAGLRVFLDAGMNVTYSGSGGHYASYTGAFAKEHPEHLAPDKPMQLNYRLEPVRAYVLSIAEELITRYDVDGVNLDFARWGYPMGFDAESLVDVLRRVDVCRKARERELGRRIQIAVRVPFAEPDCVAAGTASFTIAASQWAREGLVDRFMVELRREKLLQDTSLEHYRLRWWWPWSLSAQGARLSRITEIWRRSETQRAGMQRRPHRDVGGMPCIPSHAAYLCDRTLASALATRETAVRSWRAPCGDS